jgi:chemotaxis receptor (MCP) glutamine deamidase CheD
MHTVLELAAGLSTSSSADNTLVQPEFYASCAVETLVSELLRHGKRWLKLQAQRRAHNRRR